MTQPEWVDVTNFILAPFGALSNVWTPFRIAAEPHIVRIDATISFAGSLLAALNVYLIPTNVARPYAWAQRATIAGVGVALFEAWVGYLYGTYVAIQPFNFHFHVLAVASLITGCLLRSHVRYREHWDA